MNLFEVVFVAAVVNVAASFIFYLFQARLDDWRESRPKLVNFIGPCLLLLTAGAVLGARYVGNISLEFRRQTIPIPIPTFVAERVFLPAPQIPLASALLMSSAGMLTALSFQALPVGRRRFTERRDRRRESEVWRPSDAPWIGSVLVSTYKLTVDAQAGPSSDMSFTHVAMLCALFCTMVGSSVQQIPVELGSPRSLLRFMIGGSLQWMALTMILWL
jgi:hypothetical protein